MASKFAQNGMKYVMFGRLLFIHDNHIQARMIICIYHTFLETDN